MVFCDGKGNSQKSAVAGNIGIARCKAMVWDHDPFLARPHQILAFPFTKATAEQMEDRVPEAIFEAGAAVLRPTFNFHDMFVCTINPELEKQNEGFVNPETKEEILLLPGVDLVGSEASGVGQIASNKLPGGNLYECDSGSGDTDKCPLINTGISLVPFIDPLTGKSIFPHQLWKHIGNLFIKTVILHPSEYNLNRSEQQNKRGTLSDGSFRYSLEQIQSAAQWDYIEESENGRNIISPYQVSKQVPDFDATKVTTHHWSLEKWMPTWQGQDFVVSIKLGDKELDIARDPNPTDNSTVPNEERPEYAYLMYNPSRVPNRDDLGVGRDINPWVDNISNEAFYIPPEKGKDGSITEDAIREAQRSQRQRFDWRFNNYILIEIGSNDPQHNYFIEIVKGRKPRFLHLGEEWDHPQRLEGEGVEDSEKFQYIIKCRELSTYESISSDALFKQKKFRIFVRNHLGRLVITFEGYEDQPWVINRFDNEPGKTDFRKIPEPIVVPSGRIRIHGGNLSCGVNYSPIQYVPSATIKFVDRQADTYNAENKDLYMTFSHVGVSERFRSDQIKEQFFKDKRLRFEKIGYDDDAYVCDEIHSNTITPVRTYEIFSNQYKIQGKGWYEATLFDEGRGDVERNPDTNLPLPRETRNYASDRLGGKPHRLSVLNLRSPGRKFAFGIKEQANKNYEYPDYVSRWDVGIQLQAGSVRLPPPIDELNIDPRLKESKTFKNHITPVAKSWRLMTLGGEKPFEGKVQPFDIAPLINHINDSWSAEGFTTLNHEMQLRCYIPADPPVGQENENIFNLGQKLLKLHNRSFYLTISYWWDVGIGKREVIGNRLNDPTSDPESNDLLIQMTGVAYGAELEKSNNKLYMNFTVKDYMSVMRNQFIFNSPFFDGVQDVQVAYDLAKMSGFDDAASSRRGIDRRPLGYLQKVLKDGDKIADKRFLYNGEFSRTERYDLKGSYATLIDPSVRFQNGESFEQALRKVAEISGKTVYFDRWGVLKLETTPAIAAAFAATNGDKVKFESVFDFVTSPFPIDIAGDLGDENEKQFTFDPDKHAAHLVYNTVRYQRSVEDCINQIVIFSASNDLLDQEGRRTGGFIVKGYTFFEQIWNPESEGFFGYRKPFYQSNGVFGSLDGVQNALAIYAKMKYPPVKFQFETYGVPGLKALDIVTLDGNFLYITEISHELDPSTNRWWMNVSGEWLKPFNGELGFLKDKNPPPNNGNVDGDQ